MKIADGKSMFSQWDLNQQLIVEDGITEVRFWNGTGKESLVCLVKDENGKRTVDVPNIMLQVADPIRAYAWDEERGCTVQTVEFWVDPQPKPANYAYTQTDVLRIETEIANQLQALKDSGELTGPQGPAGPKGDPGPAEVFIAEYGKTTFAEMDEARAAGKLLFLHTGNNIVPMYDHVAGSSVSFYRITSSQVINYYRTAKGNWSNKTINLCDERITGIESNLGDIETALDTIIAIQEELINNGGGSSGGYDENACPNCGEALDSDGYCPNYCKDMESTFYVNGTPHKFHIPMTWEDFVNSGYNRKGLTCGECGSTGNDEFYTTDESVYYFTGSCCGIGYVDIKYDDENWEFVSPNSEIESEHFYIW